MDVAIIGLGLHPFGRTEGVSGLEQGAVAARAALKDAGVNWKDMQFAFGGSTDSGNADTLVSSLGLTGIPFVNVSNGCATGGSSLLSAYMAIRSGQHEIGLVVGFDKHARGAFAVDPEEWGLGRWYGEIGLALTTQFFAMKIQRYMHEFGISENTLVTVAEKAFHNGSLNPNAWRKTPIDCDTIANSPMLNHPLRKYMFCSPAEGGAALILCRDTIAKRYTSKPLFLRAAAIRTRRYGSFEVFSPDQALERTPGPSVDASRAAYEMAGIENRDVDVWQLQDTDSGAEIMHMAENGLCEDGEQEKLITDGATRIDGSKPVNTDGGCLANGEPIGASGLRQVYEICLQLRGEAGRRQVPGQPKTGYSHVYGAPGISAVTIVQR